MRFGIEFGSYPADLDPAEGASRSPCGRRSPTRIISRHCSSPSIFSPARMRRFCSRFLCWLILPERYRNESGHSIFLLPLHPPVMVAEYFSTLDNFSGGKVLFGVGQGYREASSILSVSTNASAGGDWSKGRGYSQALDGRAGGVSRGNFHLEM